MNRGAELKLHRLSFAVDMGRAVYCICDATYKKTDGQIIPATVDVPVVELLVTCSGSG